MNKKKFILLFLAICILVTNLLLFCGCFLDPEYEEGYFTYKVYKTNEGDLSTKYAIIYGLSETGMQQEHLVVPEIIGGFPVKKLGIWHMNLGYYGRWDSDALETIFITKDYIISPGNFSRCKNLNRIIFMGYYDLGVIDVNMPLNSQGKFFSRNLYETKYDYEDRYAVNTHIKPACVNYYLNYETSEPIYWADDYDNELISFVPPAPTREGFTFCGWYKETECTNQWNFETDKVSAKQYKKGYCYFEETQLYAKWTRK